MQLFCLLLKERPRFCQMLVWEKLKAWPPPSPACLPPSLLRTKDGLAPFPSSASSFSIEEQTFFLFSQASSFLVLSLFSASWTQSKGHRHQRARQEFQAHRRSGTLSLARRHVMHNGVWFSPPVWFQFG